MGVDPGTASTARQQIIVLNSLAPANTAKGFPARCGWPAGRESAVTERDSAFALVTDA